MGILNMPQFGQLPKGERLERVQSSPNYVNGEFVNFSETPVISSEKSQFAVMWNFAFGDKKNVTPGDTLPSFYTDLHGINPNENVLVWFGHSSYFLQVNGVKYLIDPVFSGYASPFSFTNKAFAGTNGYGVDDLPEIDYLIISHDHYDHLDYHTVKELKPKVGKVVCGLGVGQHFEYWGYNSDSIVELDWYDEISLNDSTKLIATPARHYSGRAMKRNQSLWASYVLISGESKVYIGGDSGYDTFFTEIGEKYGPFDLAILEQGQYNMDWQYIHMLPNELSKVKEDLNANQVFPVHNSKFALAIHSWDEPLDSASLNSSLHEGLITPMIGELVRLGDTLQEFQEWWK